MNTEAPRLAAQTTSVIRLSKIKRVTRVLRKNNRNRQTRSAYTYVYIHHANNIYVEIIVCELALRVHRLDFYSGYIDNRYAYTPSTQQSPWRRRRRRPLLAQWHIVLRSGGATYVCFRVAHWILSLVDARSVWIFDIFIILCVSDKVVAPLLTFPKDTGHTAGSAHRAFVWPSSWTLRSNMFT